jgi:glycyl-tRNA synthetase
MGLSQLFINKLGVPNEKQRFRAHLPDERAHYSKQTYDHEVKLETWGWTEVSGCAYRTDFDLRNHMEASGIDMTVLRDDGTRFVPYVVEPSFGLDRLMYVTLEINYERRKKRNILHLPRELAPYQVAVLPLVNKDGISEKAQKIQNTIIQKGFWVTYDEKGSIGRRYARSDEIGTPLAIAVDYDTRDIDVLTIRDRDSWKQVKTTVQKLPSVLEAYFVHESDFNSLGEPFIR